MYEHEVRALIDYLAALLAGANAEPASNLTRALADEIGVGRCRLPANGQTALSRTAALINGTASHIVEFDDIYRDGIYHPGCPVIAAAVAGCEHDNATQGRLLRAIIAGYEISTRIAEVIQPAHYRFWHTTGTVGMFGAAAAVAEDRLAGEARGLGARRVGIGVVGAGSEQPPIPPRQIGRIRVYAPAS